MRALLLGYIYISIYLLVIGVAHLSRKKVVILFSSVGNIILGSVVSVYVFGNFRSFFSFWLLSLLTMGLGPPPSLGTFYVLYMHFHNGVHKYIHTYNTSTYAAFFFLTDNAFLHYTHTIQSTDGNLQKGKPKLNE